MLFITENSCIRDYLAKTDIYDKGGLKFFNKQLTQKLFVLQIVQTMGSISKLVNVIMRKLFYIASITLLSLFFSSFYSSEQLSPNEYHAIYQKVLNKTYKGYYPVVMCVDGEDEILEQITMFWFKGGKKKKFLDEWCATLIKGKIYQAYSKEKKMLFKNMKQLKVEHKKNGKYNYPIIVLGPIGFKNDKEAITGVMVLENDDNQLYFACLKKTNNNWEIRLIWGGSSVVKDQKDNNNADKNKKNNLTESDISQIYNQVFDKQIVNKYRRLYVVYNKPIITPGMVNSEALFGKKEFIFMSENFQKKFTEDIEIKRDYFAYTGILKLIAPNTENVLDGLDSNNIDKCEKLPIAFSKVAFGPKGDQAYLFYDYRGLTCLETCFCYLEKENNKWELKFTFTIGVACFFSEELTNKLYDTPIIKDKSD